MNSWKIIVLLLFIIFIILLIIISFNIGYNMGEIQGVNKLMESMQNTSVYSFYVE